MDDYSGCAWIIGGLIALVIIFYVVIYIILPVTVFTIGGIAAAGAASGTFVASKNFGQVFIKAHKDIP